MKIRIIKNPESSGAFKIRDGKTPEPIEFDEAKSIIKKFGMVQESKEVIGNRTIYTYK
jgi:hypothetical protein